MKRKLFCRSLEIAVLEFVPENPNNERILALHGHLDNAATFTNVGQLLAQAGYHVSALGNSIQKIKSKLY